MVHVLAISIVSSMFCVLRTEIHSGVARSEPPTVVRSVTRTNSQSSSSLFLGDGRSESRWGDGRAKAKRSMWSSTPTRAKVR